jgi:hypothetical protein
MRTHRLIPGCRLVNYRGVPFHSPDMPGRFEGMHHGHELD